MNEDDTKKEILTIENAHSNGIWLRKARHLDDPHYSETVFMGTGEQIQLQHLKWGDTPDREPDGCYLGHGNRAWIITQDEWDKYLDLDATRAVEAKIRERNQRIRDLKGKIDLMNGREKLYTPEEAKAMAKWYNDTYNGGGEGFVPHIYTVNEYRAATEELAVLEAQREVERASQKPSAMAKLRAAQRELSITEYHHTRSKVTERDK